MNCLSCRRSRPPRGFLLAMVLICMLVAVMLLAAMLQRVMLAQRQTRLRQRQIQTQWIADSAADLAVARLSFNEDYTGESWLIDSDPFSGEDSGLAEIEVVRNSQAIKVVAVYPDQPYRGVRIEQEIRIASEAKP